MTTMTALQKFIITIVVLLVLGAGAYFWASRAQAPSTSPGQTATTTTDATSTQTGSSSPDLVLVTPDYQKPIAFSASVSSDIRTQLNARLAQIQADLTQNPLDIKAWINLGAVHKMGGDFAAAEQYWQYVLTITPNTTALYNLGDLYQNFLKDYTKAEAYFMKVIEQQPTNVNAYANLFTLYHYTLKDDTKAADILKEGLTANPGNNYLLGLQADLSAGR